MQRQVLVGGSRQCIRAVLGQGCLARRDARQVSWSRRAENCRLSTVAVLDRGGGDARGDSIGAVLEQGLHVHRCVSCRWPDSAETVEVPQLQFSDNALTMSSRSLVGAKMQVKVGIGSCAIFGENIETSLVTFAWCLAL